MGRDSMTRWRRGARASALALATLATLATLGAGDAGAQAATVDPQCNGGGTAGLVTRDACQKAIDLFQFMAPQLAATIVGGNAVQGEHSTLRGLGHFSIGIRANAIESRLPSVDQHTPAVTGAVRSDYSVEKQWIAAPVLDAAIGLFRGIPFAGTHALGLDALVNVAYIPGVDESDFSIDLPDGSLKLGFGGRLGLLRETFLTPGLSVTWLQRDLPTVNVVGRVSGDELDVRDVRVKTTAWRVVGGKSFTFLGIAIGGGQDRYDTQASAQVTVNHLGPSVTSGVIAARQELTRTNFFGNLSLNFPVLRVVAEVGRASGGTVATYNTFSGHDPSAPRGYASFGLRFTW